MVNLLSKDYGQYIKGFFTMNLGMKLEEDISPEKFNQEELATFVHEYIHFLQNITTTHGVTYFNDNSKFIRLFVSQSYKYNKNIPYPLPVEGCGIENAYEEMELSSFYLGDNEHKKIHHINDVKVEKDEIIELVIDQELQSVNIYYDDKENPYVFGTVCVEESMAYLIESIKFAGLGRTNELPYNSCELVCQKLCPGLEVRKEIIVALAELSLMHYHSGKMFVELLNCISKEEIEFNNTNEVVMYFRERVSHLFKNYEQEYNETDETIEFLYPIKTPFKPINTWLKKEMKKGFLLRNKDYNLLSRLMDLSGEKSKEYLSKLINIFGYPVICDENDEMFSGEYDLSLALVPIAVFNEYMGAETKCYLYRYCKAGQVSTLDNNCLEAPWLHSEGENLCPFGLFWYHYSLDGRGICKRHTREIR